MVDIKRHSVVSSNVLSVGYDSHAEILEVEFTHGGVYQYKFVPPGVYDALISAESIGKFIHANIKPKYACVRVV